MIVNANLQLVNMIENIIKHMKSGTITADDSQIVNILRDFP